MMEMTLLQQTPSRLQ